jgi:hypothetical protein
LSSTAVQAILVGMPISTVSWNIGSVTVTTGTSSGTIC